MSGETGFSAIWATITLFFVMGVAAISVDTGGFFSQAYDEQRAGDFACLAGVVELPDDQEDARRQAAGYLASNLNDIPRPTAGNGFDAANPVWDLRPYKIPWVFTLQPEWGSPTQMRVEAKKYHDTNFGRILGTDQVEITQESFCELHGAVPGGVFPVGVGIGFQGGVIKFEASDCVQDPLNPSGPGQCDYVDVPRFDDPAGTASGSAPTRLQYNMWLGANQPLGTTGAIGDVFCGTTPSASRCSILEMGGVAGNRAVAAYEGLIRGSANGSSTGSWLGHLEYGAQPAPFSFRSAFTQTASHAANVWNTNLLHQSASCWSPAGCSGDGDPYSGTVYRVTEYDCRDRRFVWLPVGDFIGPGADQDFYIRDFITAYLLDPIPADDNADGVRNGSDADPITGNQVAQMSAIVVDLTSAEFRYGAQDCPASPFLLGEDQPAFARLIEP